MENLEPTNNQQPITAPAGRDTVLHEIGRVIESLPAYGKHHILRIHAPKSAAVIKPGQFLHIYCNGPIVQISERLVDPVPEPSGLKRLAKAANQCIPPRFRPGGDLYSLSSGRFRDRGLVRVWSWR